MAGVTILMVAVYLFRGEDGLPITKQDCRDV